jgi:hypothetical protein
MSKLALPDIEEVSKLVHDAWWKEKKRQGFHAPMDCESDAHKKYESLSSSEKIAEFGEAFDEKRHKWCNKCHPNMYPYEELTEDEKELDRATVRSVYDAISSLSL